MPGVSRWSPATKIPSAEVARRVAASAASGRGPGRRVDVAGDQVPGQCRLGAEDLAELGAHLRLRLGADRRHRDGDDDTRRPGDAPAVRSAAPRWRPRRRGNQGPAEGPTGFTNGVLMLVGEVSVENHQVLWPRITGVPSPSARRPFAGSVATTTARARQLVPVGDAAAPSPRGRDHAVHLGPELDRLLEREGELVGHRLHAQRGDRRARPRPAMHAQHGVLVGGAEVLVPEAPGGRTGAAPPRACAPRSRTAPGTRPASCRHRRAAAPRLLRIGSVQRTSRAMS